MIIPVPTGLKYYTVTSSRHSFFLFHCHNCGKINLHSISIKQQDTETYHVFQGSEKKDSIKQKTADKATANVDAIDDRIYTSVNVSHTYEEVSQKICCASCNTQQVWSGYPKGLFSGGKAEAKKAEIAKATFEPPTYYGRQNLNDLAHGPYGALFVTLWDMIQKGSGDKIADDPARYKVTHQQSQTAKQTRSAQSQVGYQSASAQSQTGHLSASAQSQTNSTGSAYSTQSGAAGKFQAGQAQVGAAQSSAAQPHGTAPQSASRQVHSTSNTQASTKPGVAEQPNYTPKVFTIPSQPKLFKGGWQQSPNLNELIAAYNQANTLHNQNDFNSEIALLKQIEQNYPGYANTWSKLGRAQVAAGDYDAALNSYKKASKIEPHSGIVYCNIGALFMRQGHFSTAVQYYEIGLPEYFESTDEFAVALANYGYAVSKHTGDKQKAGNIIDQAGHAGYANAAKLKAML